MFVSQIFHIRFRANFHRLNYSQAEIRFHVYSYVYLIVVTVYVYLIVVTVYVYLIVVAVYVYLIVVTVYVLYT